MNIHSEWETITPDAAVAYLERVHPEHQRKFTISRAENWAMAMRGHQWMVTHQGIAFDDQGHLIDGQHRLYAIKITGLGQKMLVTRGLPVCMKNGQTNYTLDAIDRGNVRSVAEQLAIRCNVANAGRVFSGCRLIVASAIGKPMATTTTPVCALVLEKFPALKRISKNLPSQLGLRSGYIWGALALAAKGHREIETEFADKLITGEMIKRGQPVFALRSFLCGNAIARGGFQKMLRTRNAVLNCALAYLNGEKVSRIDLSENGFLFFQARHLKTLNEIAEKAGKQ